MATIEGKIVTVEQLVDLTIRKTRLFEVEKWLEKLRKKPRAAWSIFLKGSFIAQNVIALGYGISRLVAELGDSESEEKGHRFLQALVQVAAENGVEVKLSNVDRIQV